MLGKAAGYVLPGPSGQHLLPVIPGCIQPLLYLLEEKTYEEPSRNTLPPTTHLDLAIPTHSSQEVEEPTPKHLQIISWDKIPT